MMKAKISFLACVKLGIGIYIGWSIAEILDKAIGKIIDERERKSKEESEFVEE